MNPSFVTCIDGRKTFTNAKLRIFESATLLSQIFVEILLRPEPGHEFLRFNLLGTLFFLHHVCNYCLFDFFNKLQFKALNAKIIAKFNQNF